MKNNTSTETKLCFPTFSKFFRWLFSWPIIRRVLITSAVVVTLVVSFYTVELVRGKRAWNNYVAEVEARGESLDIAALIPPPVPDEENFAMIPLFRDSFNFKAPSNPSNTHGLKAFYKDSGEIRLQFSESLGNWTKGEKSGFSSFQNTHQIPNNLNGEVKGAATKSPDTLANEMILALMPQKKILTQLKEGSNKRYSQFPVNYDNIPIAVLPHLSLLNQASRTLKYRALAQLALNRSSDAQEDIMLGFYLRDAAQNEPHLIGLLVKIAIHSTIMYPVWEGIADGRWNENQLKEFQEVFSEDNWLRGFKQTMRGERVIWVETVDWLISSRENYKMFFTELLTPLDNPILYHLFPNGWVYQNKLAFCKMIDLFLTDAVNEKNKILDVQQVTSLDIENANLKSSPYHFFAKIMRSPFSQTSLKAARAQTVSDRAAIACAIERYRLATGSLPKTLDQLVPSYMETLPHDVINGEPLIYRPEGNRRYLLYSVGSDQSDDGGDFEKDWVWLYEAAPDLNAANASN
jgi:hypothetical protein